MGAIAEQAAGQAEALRARGYEVMQTWRPQGLVSRLLTTWRHFLGLVFGGVATHVRTQKEEGTGRGSKFLLLRLVAVQASPDGYKQVSQMTPLGGQSWTAPILADGKLIVRNTQAIACLSLK